VAWLCSETLVPAPCMIDVCTQGVLSTTGHSTNFIMTIELATAAEPGSPAFTNNLGQPDSAIWVKAGVAAVCALRF
jgi:hypothetical protein